MCISCACRRFMVVRRSRAGVLFIKFGFCGLFTSKKWTIKNRLSIMAVYKIKTWLGFDRNFFRLKKNHVNLILHHYSKRRLHALRAHQYDEPIFLSNNKQIDLHKNLFPVFFLDYVELYFFPNVRGSLNQFEICKKRFYVLFMDSYGMILILYRLNRLKCFKNTFD